MLERFDVASSSTYTKDQVGCCSWPMRLPRRLHALCTVHTHTLTCGIAMSSSVTAGSSTMCCILVFGGVWNCIVLWRWERRGKAFIVGVRPPITHLTFCRLCNCFRLCNCALWKLSGKHGPSFQHIAKQGQMTYQKLPFQPVKVVETFKEAAESTIGLYTELATTEEKMEDEVAALDAQLKLQTEEAKRLLETSVGVFWGADCSMPKARRPAALADGALWRFLEGRHAPCRPTRSWQPLLRSSRAPRRRRS